MRALTALVSETPVRLRIPAPEDLLDVRLTLVDPLAGVLVRDEHVRVDAAVPGAVFADVVAVPGEGPRHAGELAARFPGALVVAVHTPWRCWLRLAGGGDGPAVLTLRVAAPVAASGWAVRASVAHACLATGLPAVEAVSCALTVRRMRTAHPALVASTRSSEVRAATASSESCRPTEEYSSRASV